MIIVNLLKSTFFCHSIKIKNQNKPKNRCAEYQMEFVFSVANGAERIYLLMSSLYIYSSSNSLPKSIKMKFWNLLTK